MADYSKKTFVGVIEDNNDPKKLGRCRIRVLNVFDEIPVEDIPWATPWKDLNGNSMFVPDKGKVVTVVFDQGNIYKPEYIYAEHFNINLEKKLASLSSSDYVSMKAVMFDHKTQIYSNDSEGLKVDYKCNNINIKDTGININLKDNQGLVSIGSSNATQQAILGNHFMDWFDEFVDNLIGSKQGPYLGAVPAPEFTRCLFKYRQLRSEKFLSHHVSLVDNNYVETIGTVENFTNSKDRIADGLIGDSWKTTIKQNEITTKERTNFGGKNGNSTDKPVGPVSPPIGGSQVPASNTTPVTQATENKDVEKIIATMKSKNYVVYEKPFQLNIVGSRKQYEGSKYNNAFNDDCYVFYKDDTNNWKIHKYAITTMPGFYLGEEDDSKTSNEFNFFVAGQQMTNGKTATALINVKQSKRMINRGGLGILRPSQMIDTFELGTWAQKDALIAKKPQPVFRDLSTTDTITYTVGVKTVEWGSNCYLHRADVNTINVDNWSEGSQVFKTAGQFEDFIALCKKHRDKHGNSFSYSLIEDKDLNGTSTTTALITGQDVITPNTNTPPPNTNTTPPAPQNSNANTNNTPNTPPVDPELGTEVSTNSLKGYKYYRKKIGLKSRITVKDSTGKVIWTGPFSFAEEKIQIQEAKLANNDYNPDIPIENQV